MSEYQCFYLDGPREGEICHSEYQPREGREQVTMIGSSNKIPRPESNHQDYFRYLITRNDGTYCIASTFSFLDSELQALEKAKAAGLKPF
jgi:hypothetical protein